MSDTVTITLDREEGDNLALILHMVRGLRRDAGNEQGADEVAAIQAKLRAALSRHPADQPVQDSEVPKGLGDEDRKTLRLAADFIGDDHPLVAALRKLADHQQEEQPSTSVDREKLEELERYRDVFGDLCWGCGGSGDVQVSGPPESGGMGVCPDCNGRGTKGGAE